MAIRKAIFCCRWPPPRCANPCALRTTPSASAATSLRCFFRNPITEQAAALSRRLRAAYATAIEPLLMGIPLALDFGLAFIPMMASRRKS